VATPIADTLFRALLDDTGLANQAKQAGDAMGKTMGQSLGTTLKQTAFAALAGAAAIATVGLRELDEVTSEFRRETGATAEEAERAGKAINAMAGRNLQGMKEIGRTLSKVRTDMGLTGEAAEKTTEQFLKFAEATGQDAADAVVAFDDILDNWGLTAEDAGAIMDKLIVSHQKYGGEIIKNQETLAKLAPALRAANFEIDDGIALLGLFGSKGLDADQATAAFAKALTKVKSPQQLQAMIIDIANTENSFERARKAADLFGARAGAKLANALEGANLDDYKIGMEEAAGATEEAAEASLSFSDKVKLAMKAAGSAIIGLGQSVGPAITALAALASLGAALGIDKAIKAAFLAAAASGPVKAASLALGDTLGTIAGTRFGVAFQIAATTAIVAGVFIVAEEARKKLLEDNPLSSPEKWLPPEPAGGAKPFWELIGQQSAAAVRDGFSEGMAHDLADTVASSIKGVDATPINAAFADLFEPDEIGAGLRVGLEQLRKNIAGEAGALATSLASGGANLKTVSQTLAAELPGAVRANVAEVRRQAVLSMVAYAAGIRDKRGQATAAIELLEDDIEHAMSSRQVRLQLQGQLGGEAITKGLKSTDPIVRAQAEGTVQLITDQLTEMGVDASTLGGQAGKNYANAIRDTAPLARDAAGDVASGATNAFKTYERLGYKWGYATGDSYADGLRATVGLVSDAVSKLTSQVSRGMKASSPPVATSPLHEIDKWGARTAMAWVDGFAGAIRSARAAALGVAEAAGAGLASASSSMFSAPMTLAGAVSVPGVRSLSVPNAADAVRSGAIGPTRIYENHVHVEGLVKARDPFEIAEQLQRFQQVGNTGVFDEDEPR